MHNYDVLMSRDQSLKSLLGSYARHPVLSDSLVLQGGGALRFFYDSPRVPTDVDFVLSPRAADLEDVVSALERSPVTLQAQRVFPRVKHSDVKLVRASYTVSEQLPAARAEIYDLVTEKCTSLPFQGGLLRVESPDELLTDKVVATLSRFKTRSSTKPADLFDIDYIYGTLGGRCNAEDVQDKLQKYGEVVYSSHDVQQLVSYLRDPRNTEAFRKGILKNFISPKDLRGDIVSYQEATARAIVASTALA